jgi:hypothetical protein
VGASRTFGSGTRTRCVYMAPPYPPPTMARVGGARFGVGASLTTCAVGDSRACGRNSRLLV